MRDSLGSPPRHSASRFSGGIGRTVAPWRANTVPYVSIVLGSLFPVFFLAPLMPILPPTGFMMLLAWRIMRPGFLPLWIGVPLGAFDDLFSGQPFGSGILLWSICMIVLEIIEARFPWRGFWQDWITAGLALIIYIVAAMVVSGATLTLPLFLAAIPQIVLAILLYPVLSRLIAWLDRYRLTRARRVG